MRRFIIPTAACLSLLICGSCDDSFNPSAPFQPRMVVYSILTTDSDTQYVRVYSTYNPPNNDATKNPDEISVNDAQVSVQEEGGGTFSFQRMTIPRAAKDGYPSDIVFYYSYPFRAQRGRKYTLTVLSPSMGSVTAKTTVPGQASITPVNTDALINGCLAVSNFGVSVTLSPEAEAFLTHIYVDYLSPDVYGTYQPKRFEMPLRRDIKTAYLGSYKDIYPSPKRRSTPSAAPATVKGREYKPEEQVSYSSDTFCHIVDDLYLSGIEGCVHFRQAVFYLIQFDAPLWNYYSVANIFKDRFSVRTDEPDYTNVKNGIGVFGSMSVDSTVLTLPRIIPYHVPQYTVGCK